MTCSIYINATDVTVCDNDISSSTESGITINGAGLKPMIHDNRIHNCAAWGVDARYGCEPFIHDNRISDNTQGGVLFNEAGGTLSNNNIFENGPFGVKVRGPQVQPSTLTIDDNQIGNHSDAGVLVEVGVVSIQGNTIFSYMEMGDGIEITGSGVAQVVGNTISNCGHNGIYLNYSEAIPPSHIVGNTIRFNTFGIAGGMGCPLAIISSNIILQNVQDITYIPPT